LEASGMLADVVASAPPNLFYALGVPVIAMAVSAIISLILYKGLGRIFRS
jgi:hypothetical protein